jgi:hypothetical protein
MATITDHIGGVAESYSISFLASMDARPVRKATRTASRAAGISSNKVREVLIAAATKDPVQSPMV